MNFFVYMPRPGARGGRLLGDVVRLALPDGIEVFSDLQSLTVRIRRPKDPPTIVLVFDPTADELRGLADLRDFLGGARILLVLSEQGAETIALAHRLLPTFIAPVDNGQAELLAVIRRLLGNRPDETLPATKLRLRGSNS